MTDSLSIAVHAFASRVLMYFSIVETLYCKQISFCSFKKFCQQTIRLLIYMHEQDFGIKKPTSVDILKNTTNQTNKLEVQVDSSHWVKLRTFDVTYWPSTQLSINEQVHPVEDIRV